jgi:hypothetical protein
MHFVRAQRAVNNVTMSSYERMPGCMLCIGAASHTECVAELVQSGKEVHATPQSATQKWRESRPISVGRGSQKGGWGKLLSSSREVKGVSPEGVAVQAHRRTALGDGSNVNHRGGTQGTRLLPGCCLGRPCACVCVRVRV